MTIKAISLFDVNPSPGAVFVDNLMLASADRLVLDRYQQIGRRSPIATSPAFGRVFSNDLLNLGLLVETLVLSEEILTNADLLYTWCDSPHTGLVEQLQSLVVGVTWPPTFRSELESYAFDNKEFGYDRDSLDLHALDAANISYFGYYAPRPTGAEYYRSDESKIDEAHEEQTIGLVLPYDEASRPADEIVQDIIGQRPPHGLVAPIPALDILVGTKLLQPMQQIAERTV